MTHPARRAAAGITAAIAVLAAAAPLEAQRPQRLARGSRIIATDEWMHDAVARLRARGRLPGLNPLTQPWARLDVAAELEKIPAGATDTMPTYVGQLIRLLRAELAPELLRLAGRDSVNVGLTAWGGGVAATSPRVDPLLPHREGVATLNGKPRNKQFFWPQHGAAGWGERGPFAVDLRIGWDLAIRRADPDGRFQGRIFDVFPDNEVAYASGRWSDAGVVVGRLRRNWAPVGGAKGMMLSDNAFGIPQVGYEVGGRNLILRGLVGELDTILGRERYLAVHRLEFVTENLALSIGESKVYLSRGGPRLSSLNPIEVFFVTGDKLGGEEFTNTGLDGQLWLRRGALTLGGETFVDDLWVTNRAPARLAISGFATVATPSGMEFGGEYRVVTSFAYWTPLSHQNLDQMTYLGRGLGDNASDYDRWTLHANVFPPIVGLRLTPTVAFQRQGEFDFRRPGIADSVWNGSRALFQGVTERTTRLALAGRFQRTRRLFADWDAGVNFVSNTDHVRGASRTEFSAMLRVALLWSAPDRAAP